VQRKRYETVVVNLPAQISLGDNLVGLIMILRGHSVFEVSMR
jgi:hypothetical protein